MAQFQKDEIKEKILDSALTVFTDKGFQLASIKVIAGEAGVSVGNVYRYFENKEALYYALISDVEKGVIDIMNHVEEVACYKQMLEHEPMDTEGFFKDMIEPMAMFTDLYKAKRPIFEMLLKNRRDVYYERTVERIILILQNYFYRFWGSDLHTNGISRTEVNALTHAVVFSVIELLNDCSEAVLDNELRNFTGRLIKGYFTARNQEATQS